MKILITGGHLTPALSFIDHALKKGDDLVFVGRSHSNKSLGIKSRERIEVQRRKIVFENLDSFKLHRHKKLLSILELPKLLSSIIRSSKIIRVHKPDVVVSFGGYLAIPVAIAAKVKKIPIFTHEQTKHLGLSNKYISHLADVIGISWKDTHNLPSNKNIIYTGNPIRKEIVAKAKKPSWVKSKKPILYITGGNQGSVIINQTIGRLISKLSKSFFVVHQCGGSGTSNYLSDLEKFKDDLPESQKENYFIKEWFSAAEVSWLLERSTCTISRSGANTISEIIHKSSPVILIPLPFSAHNEQYKNAKVLESYHGAILIPQNKLSDKLLVDSIKEIKENNQQFRANLKHAQELLVSNPQKHIYKIVSMLNEKTQTK